MAQQLAKVASAAGITFCCRADGVGNVRERLRSLLAIARKHLNLQNKRCKPQQWSGKLAQDRTDASACVSINVGHVVRQMNGRNALPMGVAVHLVAVPSTLVSMGNETTREPC